MTIRTITLAAAVNDDAVLDTCLLASPDVRAGVPFSAYRGFRSAAAAYNRAIAESDATVLVLAHQDVYFPAGWFARLDETLASLDRHAPDWAVAGLIGLHAPGDVRGQVWSSGLGKVVGTAAPLPARAVALDEMVLVLRAEAGLRFDEGLPDWHLYAADIIQIAQAAGRSAWIVGAPAVHHSRPVIELGGGYRRAWNYMRAKWRDELPISNLVCPITRSPLPLLKRDLSFRWRNRRRRRTKPQGEPSAIAHRLGWE